MPRRPAPLLALVIPCYNEEAVLQETTFASLAALLEKLKAGGKISAESFALYVNDGSSDRTWQLIEERHARDPFCRGICFAANAGEQNAIWAGMDKARDLNADCTISVAADLQDDLAAIPEMIEHYRDGSDIVFGARNDRSLDSAFKRRTAEGFYALMKAIGVRLVPNHADYRLVGRKVLNVLPRIHDQTLFTRGLFPSLGFAASVVYYKRQERRAGESKYPLSKMLGLAMHGITSCSVAPLRLAGLFSCLCMLLALIACGYALASYFSGSAVSGWTSLIIVSLFLGAVQLLCLALMGEYIANIFTEVRRRPRYIVDREL